MVTFRNKKKPGFAIHGVWLAAWRNSVSVFAIVPRRCERLRLQLYGIPLRGP
jgi:hypothetical protein